ncbi:MAG TPA: YihY/virulence factor BrkB family protein [Polyangia bacterium]
MTTRTRFSITGRARQVREFLVALKNAWRRHALDDVAGSVTFFGVLGLFPFLVFLLALASLVISPAQTEELIRQLGRVTPPEVTAIFASRVRGFARQPSLGLLTIGALGAAWSATGAVVALMNALNTVHGVRERRPFWKVRVIAILVTLFGAAGGLVAALLGVAAPAVGTALGPAVATAVGWLRLPVAGLVMMIVWAVLYHVLPDVEQRFRLITPGSIAGVLLWLVASWGFSLYLTHFPTSQAVYGALGGVVVLLLWMWISSMALLLGATINVTLTRIRGQARPAAGDLADRCRLRPRARASPRRRPRPP